MRKSSRPFLLVLAAVVAGWGCHGLLAGTEDGQQDPLSPLCWFCHPWTARQWKASAHASATTSPAFRAQVAEAAEPDGCYACHAPGPLLAAGLATGPSARLDGRELGVTCQSCHEDGVGAQVGPLASDGSPFHACVEDPALRNEPGLCAACHGDRNPLYDQASYYLASDCPDQGLSCQTCHMRTEKGPIAYSTRRVARERANHDVLGPADAPLLARAARLAVSVAGGQAEASLTSTGVGHLLPGSAGPRVELEILALSKTEAELDSEATTVGWDGVGPDTRLAPSESLSVTLTVPAGTGKIRAVARYLDDARGLSLPLAQAEAAP